MDAFTRDLVAFTPKLRKYAVRLTGTADRADDLVQDTLVKALAKRHLYQPDTNLLGWLMTIQRNLFLAGLRKRNRLVADPDGLMSDAFMAPDDLQAALEARGAIEVIFEMPSPWSDALIDAGLGRTLDEVARDRSVSTGTVKSRLNRARTELAAALGEERRMLKQRRPTFAD